MILPFGAFVPRLHWSYDEAMDDVNASAKVSRISNDTRVVVVDLTEEYNPEPKSNGGDNPITRRCYRNEHHTCTGSWTQYPDQSGPCECPCHKSKI